MSSLSSESQPHCQCAVRGHQKEARLKASAIAFKAFEKDTGDKKGVTVREMAGGTTGGSCFASTRRGFLIGSRF